MNWNTKEIRQKLKRYDLYYKIDLQFIWAVIIENYSKCNDACISKFVKFFNDEWNINYTLKYNKRKRHESIAKYIDWKYYLTREKPNESVMKQIKGIFKFYKRIWKPRKKEFDSVKLKRIERSLFRLLKYQSNPHPYFDFQSNYERFHEAEFLKNYLIEYNLDHVVEIQILAFITNGKIDRHLATKFIEYFNNKLNFKKISREENNIKSKHVLQWRRCFELGKFTSNIYWEATMNDIFVHYRTFRSTIQNRIANDKSLKSYQKKLLKKTESILFTHLLYTSVHC